MEYFSRPASDTEIYRLLRHFTLIRFDLLHDGAHDEADAEERLRPFLRLEDTTRSGALWDRLKTIAREAAGSAADFTRTTLLEHLRGEFRLAGALSVRRDIEKLVTARPRERSSCMCCWITTARLSGVRENLLQTG